MASNLMGGNKAPKLTKAKAGRTHLNAISADSICARLPQPTFRSSCSCDTSQRPMMTMTPCGPVPTQTLFGKMVPQAWTGVANMSNFFGDSFFAQMLADSESRETASDNEVLAQLAEREDIDRAELLA